MKKMHCQETVVSVMLYFHIHNIQSNDHQWCWHKWIINIGSRQETFQNEIIASPMYNQIFIIFFNYTSVKLLNFRIITSYSIYYLC